MRAPNRSALALLVAIAAMAVALVAVGCGGDDNENSSAGNGGGGSVYGGGGGGTDTSAAATAGSGVVSVADNPKLGKILVDSRGFTLYNFEKDKGGKSSCFDACAAAWPPLIVSGEPKAQNGAEASKLSTTDRSDGGTQVVYNGWPLYTYEGDTKPGDTTGNDLEQFGAEWYALTPAGEKPKD
jgi:predicted lipoprotein with Yx(FWY)xxD motif